MLCVMYIYYVNKIIENIMKKYYNFQDSIKHLFGSDLTSQLQNIKKIYAIDDNDDNEKNLEEEENIDDNITEIRLKTSKTNNSKNNIIINSILFKPGVGNNFIIQFYLI